MLLLMLASAWAQEPTVLSLEEALRMLEEAEQVEPGPARRWTPSESRTILKPVEGGLEVVQELDLLPLEPGWVALRLLDGRVILDGGGSDVFQGPDGNWWWVGRLERARTLKLSGFLPTSATATELIVAQGVRQRVVGEADGLEVVVEGAVAGALPPTDRLAVAWRPERPKPPQQNVVQAEVATAAWILDEGMEVRSHVRFAVRRGEVQTFTLRVPGVASELEVTGPRVESWRQAGDQIIVQATGPVAGAMEMTLSWRQPLTKNKTTVHVPEPQGVNSSAAFLTLAGSGELLLIPSVGGALRPTALSELPPWARGVGDATPGAAWSGKGQLQVQALRLDPIDGPPLVIDFADCVVAFAETGRNLTRCRLDVRNDSEQFLIVRAPEGTELWSARVSGEGVSPVRMDDGSTAVPLERSVETLAGLTAIDVELTFRGELEPWARKGERELALPSYNAPVARLEWELRLPPTFHGEREEGSATLLSGEDTGVSLYTYSGPRRGRKDAEPPEEPELERKEDKAQEYAARDTWNNALRAYQDNDFSSAQGWIDQTLQLDPDNENAVRLQTNLDVLSGRGENNVGGDEVMSRRVKDMAKAKVSGVEIEQEEAMRKAEEAMRMGDYDRAIEELEKSIEIAEELQVYEQSESREQLYRASSSSASLAMARQKKAEMQAPPAELFNGSGGKDGEELEEYDEDMDGVFDDEAGGIGGLIGAKGTQIGSGGLGTRGSGLGGGGTADGLGGLGTKGRGSGASGYGSGSGSFSTAPQPEVVEPSPVIDTATVSQGQTLSKEFLERVPTGRSYQSAVESVPGVVSGDTGAIFGEVAALEDGKREYKTPAPEKKALAAAPAQPMEPDYAEQRVEITRQEIVIRDPSPVDAPPPPPPKPSGGQRMDYSDSAPQSEVTVASGSYSTYNQRTEIDFEDIEISGELVKPQGELLLDRNRSSMNPLIDARDEFEIDEREALQTQPMPDASGDDFGGDYWTEEEPVFLPSSEPASADSYYYRERRGLRLPSIDLPSLGAKKESSAVAVATPQSPPTSTRVAQPQSPPAFVSLWGVPEAYPREGYVAYPANPPQRATDPSVLAASPELPKRKPIEATSLAIPLPDHGESIVVGQRLLAPGEAPTLTVTYREPLCDPNCFSR